MRKNLYICLIAIIMVTMSNNTYSQFVNAQNNDILAASSDNVENTGNDVQLILNNPNYNMYIMAWDGDRPAFAWNDEFSGTANTLAIAGTQIGTVTDPDIVLYDNNVMWAQIVYLLDDNVYYESWRFNVGTLTWNLTNGPTAITQNGGCTCPNVDVGFDGKTVAVWEENGQIYASAGDITGNFQAPFLIAEAHTPDVALNFIQAQSTYVNFTFISDNGNNTQLCWIVASYLNISNGNPALGPPTTLHTAFNNEYYGKPRIAGPIIVSLNNPAEYEIVVKHYHNGRYDIRSHHINNPGGVIINDFPVNLTAEINLEPVVSYVGDHIISSWTYDDTNLGNTSNTIDIISRQLLASNGTAPPPILLPPPGIYIPFNVYSVVNNNTAGVQAISSVAGRFATIASGEKKLVTFYNENNSQIYYKIRPYANVQFRTKSPEIQADVYPNPTSNIVNIKIDTEFETAKLELYNLQGQKLMQKEITEQKFELDVSELNAGIYKLRVSTGSSSETKSIEIIR